MDIWGLVEVRKVEMLGSDGETKGKEMGKTYVYIKKKNMKRDNFNFHFSRIEKVYILLMQ